MDYKTLKVGQETSHGNIEKIYASSDDFIVFKTDDVYRQARNMATKLQAEGGQKFQGVFEDTLNENTGTCLGQAMQKGVEALEIEQCFQPLKHYIGKTPRIKKLLGYGEIYQHRVFLMDDGGLGWTSNRHDDDHLASQLAKLDRLSRLTKTQMMRRFRSNIVASIGAAVHSVFCTKTINDREAAVQEVTDHVTRNVQEYHHAVYLLILIVAATLMAAGTLYLVDSDSLPAWRYAAVAGIVGAVISSLQRTKTTEFELTQSRTNVVVQAISRIIIGLSAGILVVVASKAGLAFSFVEGNTYATVTVAFAAGFSERFIPDIVATVTSKM